MLPGNAHRWRALDRTAAWTSRERAIGKETEMGMLDDLKVMKRAMTGYLWKRWDMFWLGINGRTEAAFAEAELGNDEERYYWIWFRAIMPEGSAWWKP